MAVLAFPAGHAVWQGCCTERLENAAAGSAMRKMQGWKRKGAALLGAMLLTTGFDAAEPAAEPRATDDFVLVRLVNGAGRLIRDSKWGMIGSLQGAINAWAAPCGVEPVARDGLFGKATAAAARAVALCRGFQGAGDLAAATLTSSIWKAVTGAAPPSPLQRARLLTHTMEGMDYDRLDWNICSARVMDRDSVLTWGPYGKTLGWGGELLGVLHKLDRQQVLKAFTEAGAEGGAALLDLKTREELRQKSAHLYPGARALMERVCLQPGQKAAWEQAFARLGADPAVQKAYEEVAWGEESWFRYVVERLSRSWREAGLEPSEVDYAFFSDRAVHMGWGANRFAAVDQALAEARAQAAGGALSNAAARLAVSAAVTPKARPEDRAARDAIFLVDSVGELGEAMAATAGWPRNWRELWEKRAGVSAADLGLSDARPAPGFDDALRAPET
ncbi:MAG: hypothetical protein K2P95_06235 [Hyphomonadaceae bacterium]|nr:hypothetical protein [Hyphomonadaceae bacterium]